MTDEVLFTQNKQLGVIILSRASALNALTLTMIQAIQAQLIAWESDETVQAVIIQSDSPKAFCAGGDVRWLYETGRQDPELLRDFFRHEYRLNHYIQRYPKPYIALLDGMTMGGGVGVSLHGSHPIASELFKFAMPETSIGFFPDIGASHLLAHCPSKVGIYLGLTGNRLNAAEALFCGLVKAIVASQQFPDLVEVLANTDLKTDSFNKVDACLLKFTKDPSSQAPLDDERSQASLDDEQGTEAAPIKAHLGTIAACFSHARLEEILASLKSCQLEWTNAVYSTLLSKSPLALKVTLEQLRRAQTLSMAECIKMDYCLVGHFMKDVDFYEGVRALLIDKDKSPHWQPATLEEVSQAKVADYFECVGAPLDLIEVG